MEATTGNDVRRFRYATGQPILAEDETVIGYKLINRTDVVSHFRGADPDASVRTAIDMSTLLGLDILCDHRQAFIGCNRDILLDQDLAILPPDRVVAEIEKSVTVDAVFQACCELKNATR